MQKNVEKIKEKLSKLIFVNDAGVERSPNEEEINKMLALCQKRSNPSYYKLRHASGLDESYFFKGINIYTDDGQKMRRFESGLDEK